MTTTETPRKTERIEFPVSARTTGKHNVRRDRTAGYVPGVVYGPKLKPIPVMAEMNVVTRYYGRKFESTIFTLKSDNPEANKQAVLIREIQVHPVTRRPQHVDFYAIDLDSTVRVSISIVLQGKPVGLSDGGVLQPALRELEIECRPDDIPPSIEVDVTDMGVGDTLHVSDLKVPANIKILSLQTLTVASVNVPKEETATPVAAAAAAPAEGAAATPAAGAAPAAAAGGAKGAAPAAGGDKKK